MTQAKRYEMYGDGYGGVESRSQTDGDWVRYEDYAEELLSTRAQRDEALALVADLRFQVVNFECELLDVTRDRDEAIQLKEALERRLVEKEWTDNKKVPQQVLDFVRIVKQRDEALGRLEFAEQRASELFHDYVIAEEKTHHQDNEILALKQSEAMLLTALRAISDDARLMSNQHRAIADKAIAAHEARVGEKP